MTVVDSRFFILIQLLHINVVAYDLNNFPNKERPSFTAQMKFSFTVALLALGAVQAAAFPGLDGGSAAAPRMIKPKYRSTAKRAIIRTGPFTLKARGVSSLKCSWLK
jgi:hypothetical protein